MTYLKEYLKVSYKFLSLFGFVILLRSCVDRDPIALYLAYLSLMLGTCGPIAFGLKGEK